MKKDIHPVLVDCTVTCACGNTFVTKSQKDTMRIDICNECHPFFTGSERMVDTAGRIEKFNARYGKK
jgi:large subunit ribosomal protein L31